MKIEYYQHGELMIEDCFSVAFANDYGDIIIHFTENTADYLILDKDNFVMVRAN